MKTTSKNQTLVATAAVASLLALGAATAQAGAHAGGMEAKEKCYGIAMAGQNDCAANGHSCQGQAKTDKDPSEWKNVPKGKCAEMGGSDMAGKKAS
jgi:uncharacterized membrane protein